MSAKKYVPPLRGAAGGTIQNSWAMDSRRYVVSAALCFLFVSPAVGQVEVLHTFSGSPADGAFPDDQSRLLYHAGTLYGVTSEGGTTGFGVLFSIQPDGQNFQVLRSFFPPTDGVFPAGPLSLVGDRLYGTAPFAGALDAGVVYGFGLNDSSLDPLVSFDIPNGLPGSLASPRGRVAHSGGTLFGVTFDGGQSGAGGLFSVSTTGEDFVVLHEFPGTDSGGGFPNSGVVISGNRLFGVAPGGTFNDVGVLYSYDLDDSGVQVLHQFGGGPTDGDDPSGHLLLDGSTLYGVTDDGGPTDDGTVYRIDADGSDYEVLHFFDEEVDGKDAEGGLCLAGGVLYGMTEDGGQNANGILYGVRADGDAFHVLHDFDSGVTGADPEGELIFVDDYLIGMANDGGGPFGAGTLFRLNPCSLHPYGDVDCNLMVSAADVQCAILTGIWEFQGAADERPDCGERTPLCAFDLNCNASIDVGDIQLATLLATGESLPPSTDADGDGLFDACTALPCAEN